MLLALSLSLAPTLSAETTRSTEASYTTAGGRLVSCQDPGIGTGGVGGVCLALEPEDRSVSISIDDDTAQHVGATYRFVNDGGVVLGSGTFCDEAHLLALTPAVDSAATTLEIIIDGPRGPTHCPSGLGVGTQGTVRATFSDSV